MSPCESAMIMALIMVLIVISSLWCGSKIDNSDSIRSDNAVRVKGGNKTAFHEV